MVKWVLVAWGAAAALLVAGGCGGDSSGGMSSAQAGQMGVEAAGSSPVPSCVKGDECLCEDGLLGKKVCSPSESCDCEHCPAFEPHAAAEFDTCVGNVIGDWTLESAELETEPLRLVGSSNQDIGTCESQLIAKADDLRFNLSIPDNGTARLFLSELSAVQRVLTSCTEPLIGVSCSGTEIAGKRCSESACGLCDCPVGWDEYEDESVGLDLSTELLTLRTGFGSDEGTVAAFQYCAAGDRLTLNLTGFKFHLRKVKFEGTPTPCSQRSQKDCDTRDGCQPVNGYCLGVSDSTCSIGAYGVSPGCVVVEPGAACVPKEKIKPCAEQSNAACATVAGCSLVESCSGPGADCVTIFQATGVCDEAIGCVPVGSAAGCAGTVVCSDQKAAATCTAGNQCTWKSDCVGTAAMVTCSDYDVSECATHAGCVVGSL